METNEENEEISISKRLNGFGLKLYQIIATELGIYSIIYF